MLEDEKRRKEEGKTVKERKTKSVRLNNKVHSSRLHFKTQVIFLTSKKNTNVIF